MVGTFVDLGKNNINPQDQMVRKIKENLFLGYYQVNLMRKFQNLRHKKSSVKEYTKKFYKLYIKSGHANDEVKIIARYLNILRILIQDEIILVKIQNIKKSYQYAVKIEEKLNKK